jgi:hypothetical protein
VLAFRKALVRGAWGEQETRQVDKESIPGGPSRRILSHFDITLHLVPHTTGLSLAAIRLPLSPNRTVQNKDSGT